jgi:uncharacterized protein
LDTTTLEQLRLRAGQLACAPASIEGQALQPVLSAGLARHPGVQMLLVSSSDGRALASETAHLQADPRRIAAMGNSFLTLGETLAREMGLSQASHVTLSTAHGNMVLVRVAGPGACTLAALADEHMPLAMLLYVARDCAAQVAAAL